MRKTKESKPRHRGEKDKQRSIDTEKKKLSHEIIKFYTSELILAKLSAIESSFQDGEYDIPVKTRMRIADLRVRFTNEINSIFNWIREYLVYAISTELEHQSQVGTTNTVEIPRIHNIKQKRKMDPVDKFIIYSRTREILLYLKLAAQQFNKKGWSACFGGKKWAAIAKIARAMWTDPPFSEKCVLIDKSFQIEHNGGMIFDKRPEKINSDDDRNKRILTIKKRSADLVVLVENFMHYDKSGNVKKMLTSFLEAYNKVEAEVSKKRLRGD